MARSARDRFLRERDRIADLDDDSVRHALLQFADAVDPEVPHVEVPQFENGEFVGHDSESNSTAKNYLSALRCAHLRGLDLFGADTVTINRFMQDLVADPDQRRYDLVGPPTPHGKESPSKPTAKSWQSALRNYYRFCTDPHATADRPDMAVPWEAVNGVQDIIMFSERSEPMHDEADMPDQADLDAMREACLHSQNTRRDRAFLELAAGTGQRVYALVTLKVKHVHLDGQYPHILLNPDIKNDGDKGAIENAGRWRPIVTDPDPIRQWIRNHPMRDPDVRADHGAPNDFEDCYLFVGSLKQRSTDATDHWGTEAARDMLERRKATTANLPGVTTVEVPVNPHNWRHYAYTRSQEVPNIDESDRRKMFGWAPGSDTGQTVYGHKETEEAGKAVIEGFREAFGDAATEGIAEQIVGDAAAGDLSPEARRALVQELIGDDAAMQEIADAVAAAADAD